jgi:hypothetical protein
MSHRVVVAGLCALASLLVLVFSVVRADASISISQKLSESDTSNLSSYTTAGTMSLATGAVGICFITSGDNTTPVTPSLSGGSAAAWTQIATVTFDTIASAVKRMTAFRALGSGASAATLVADFSGDSQTGIMTLCYEATGVNVAGTNAADAIEQVQTGAADGAGSFSVTLSSALQPGSAVIMAAAGASSTSWTEEAGYTAGTLQTMASPTMRSRAQWEIGGSDNSPLWTYGGTPNVAGIALELALPATLDCDGPGTQDFYLCVQSMDGTTGGGQPITVRSYTLSNNSELDGIPGTEGTDPNSGLYYHGTDTPDASRLQMQELQFSISNQITFDVGVDTSIDQDVLIMTDVYRRPSWRLAAIYGAGTGSSPTQKSFQHRQGQQGGAAIHWEMQETTNGRNNVTGSGVAAGFNGVQPIQLTAITASGTTATATYSGSPAITNGQSVTISGPTNLYQIAGVSISSGAVPTLTTSSAHGLVGSFSCLLNAFTGDTPNINNTIGRCTVTGANTMSVVSAPTFSEFRANGSTMTVGGTGGILEMYPYGAMNVTATVVDSTHFTYPIAGLGTASATATIPGSGAWAIGDPDTQITGTDCETIGGIRPYPTFLYGGTPSPRPALANAIVPCNTWVRMYELFEFNQGSSWTCGGITGKYDYYTSYAYVAGAANPVQVYDRTTLEFDYLTGLNGSGNRVEVDSPAECSSLTSIQRDRQEYVDMDFEHNSSSGGGSHGNSIDRIGFQRNWQMVSTPVSSGVITPSATSIDLNGTEVLLPPVP